MIYKLRINWDKTDKSVFIAFGNHYLSKHFTVYTVNAITNEKR